MQENENVRNIDVSITFPDKNSSKQEHDEVAILLFRKNNDKIRDTINNYLGIDYDSLSNYQVFVILWLILKSIEGYTHAKAITGIDIWNMKICMLNNAIVFVNGDGEIVFNEEIHKRISDDIWNKIEENSKTNP